MLTTDMVLTGCQSIKNNTNTTQRGAGIGAGAVAGGIVGRKSGNTVIGAILGFTVGGATEAGRAKNRRVDVAVFADKKLIKATQKGDLARQ